MKKYIIALFSSILLFSLALSLVSLFIDFPFLFLIKINFFSEEPSSISNAFLAEDELVTSGTALGFIGLIFALKTVSLVFLLRFFYAYLNSCFSAYYRDVYKIFVLVLLVLPSILPYISIFFYKTNIFLFFVLSVLLPLIFSGAVIFVYTLISHRENI